MIFLANHLPPPPPVPFPPLIIHTFREGATPKIRGPSPPIPLITERENLLEVFSRAEGFIFKLFYV